MLDLDAIENLVNSRAIHASEAHAESEAGRTILALVAEVRRLKGESHDCPHDCDNCLAVEDAMRESDTQEADQPRELLPNTEGESQ